MHIFSRQVEKVKYVTVSSVCSVVLFSAAIDAVGLYLTITNKAYTGMYRYSVWG